MSQSSPQADDEPPRTRVQVRYFVPTVDVDFGPVGSATRFKGLRPSDGLPKRRPRVLFAGVNAEGEAVFSLAMGGLALKGGCEEPNCPLVAYLCEGDRQLITTPRGTFVLRVAEIRARPQAR